MEHLLRGPPVLGHPQLDAHNLDLRGRRGGRAGRARPAAAARAGACGDSGAADRQSQAGCLGSGLTNATIASAPYATARPSNAPFCQATLASMSFHLRVGTARGQRRLRRGGVLAAGRAPRVPPLSLPWPSARARVEASRKAARRTSVDSGSPLSPAPGGRPPRLHRAHHCGRSKLAAAAAASRPRRPIGTSCCCSRAPPRSYRACRVRSAARCRRRTAPGSPAGHFFTCSPSKRGTGAVPDGDGGQVHNKAQGMTGGEWGRTCGGAAQRGSPWRRPWLRRAQQPWLPNPRAGHAAMFELNTNARWGCYGSFDK